MYVKDIFVLFECIEQPSKFCAYFNACHPNMSFHLKKWNMVCCHFQIWRTVLRTSKFETTVYGEQRFVFCTPIWNYFANSIQIWYDINSFLVRFQTFFWLNKIHEEHSFLNQMFLKANALCHLLINIWKYLLISFS